MDKDQKTMYDFAVGGLIDKYSANGKFFTQSEFEANKGKIFILTKANSNLTDKLKNLNNGK